MIIPEANRLNHVKEYYFSRKLQEIRDMQAQGKDVINLGIGNPDFAPSEATIEALMQSANNPANHGYQSYKGVPELRSAIAGWYTRIYNVALDPDREILPLIGSKEGIMHISMAFLNEGDEVLVPNPGYPTYTSVSRLVGAKIKTYNLDENNDWGIDVHQLKNMDLSRVKIMWVNFPNMPTGANGSDGLFNELIALARENKFLICNDNPYSLILNNNPRSLLKYEGAMEVMLELNSLSKSHNMAGWRLGWVSGQADYINTVLKVKSNMDSGMFLGLQHAAIEAMNNTDDWHREQNKIYEQRRALTWELLDLLDCRYNKNQTGMFVWAKVPERVEHVEKFLDELLHGAHVFITPGFIFGSNGERFVRASLCNKVEVVKDAMVRIEKFVKSNIAKV
ncbi:aminotransferase class I/II-fold pyridoxal phosphate-dependent enzyme [Fulvivirgaceae bacterium BMA10]|uniref:Aminotransferase n=1 Tax=Splendidivirga corallicola TaxID=3051826 RepID=A0ABT8KQX3_9BACT|nr:aminotransferase class I/II-fold pyridoxal phosphate-dependent enzyme [Fulvivirgaceae bacterium BMA10]